MLTAPCVNPAGAFGYVEQCIASSHVQEGKEHDHTQESIAKAAEAATRSSAAALLKQQQRIPVKVDYFLPDDEQADGRLAASSTEVYFAGKLSFTAHSMWLIQLRAILYSKYCLHS